MKQAKLLSFFIAIGLASSAPLRAADEDITGETKQKVDVTQVELGFEAGTDFFVPWSSGKTIHSGIGHIKPYGSADYFCGLEYSEQKDFPLPQAVSDWFAAGAISKKPLFCIYRVKDQGDIYAYDFLIGHSYLNKDKDGRNSEVVNLVAGGTGKFKGVTGVWVGTTDGRGEMTERHEGLMLPKSIIKWMDGYVRVLKE